MRVCLTGATGFVGSNVARGDLLAFGPPEPHAVPPELRGRVPYDTSLDARATAAALDVAPADLHSMPARLRAEIDTGRPHHLEAIAA